MCALLLWLLLALWVAPSSGMCGSESAIIGAYELGQIFEFQFAAGGTATLSVTQSLSSVRADESPVRWSRWPQLPLSAGRAAVTAPSQADDVLNIMLCTEADLENNILTFPSMSALCAATDLASRCSAFKRLENNGNLSVVLPITDATVLHMIFAACSSSPQRLTATWNCENPGGEALPTGQIPLKSWTITFGAIWATCAGLLAINLAHASMFFAPPPAWTSAQLAAEAGDGDEALRDPQLHGAVRLLHWGLLGTAAAFSVEGFIGSAYWKTVSRTCHDVPSLAVSDIFAWDIASALLVGLIMLVSRGWQVTRLHLERKEYSALGGLIMLYLVAWLSWQFFASVTSLFLLMLAYVLMLRYTFASSAWSLRLLLTFNNFSQTVRNALGTAPAGGAADEDAVRGEYTPLTGGAGPTERPAWRWPWSRAPVVARTSGQPDTPRAEVDGADVSVIDGGLSARQIRFMRIFRIVAGVYISVDMIAELATDVLPSSSAVPWVGYSTQIIAAFVSWAFLAWTFRAQADPAASPLFDPRGYLETSPLTAELLGDEARGTGGADLRWGYAGRIGGDDDDDALAASNAAARAASILVASSAAASRARSTTAEQVVFISPGDQGQGSYVLAEQLPVTERRDDTADPAGWGRAAV